MNKETLVQKGYLTWEHKKNDDPDKLTGEQWLQALAAGMPKVRDANLGLYTSRVLAFTSLSRNS